MSGVGKSRLASELALRASEAGVATPLTANHDPIPGQLSGVAGMFLRHLRCTGLPPDRVRERVAAALAQAGPAEPWLVQGLSDCLADRGRGAQGVLRWDERLALQASGLAHLARQRPLILVLDDVQWAHETVDLVAHLLGPVWSSRLPALIVLTRNDGALHTQSAQADRLQDLVWQDQMVQSPVQPLSDAHLSELIEELLLLEQSLAAQVRARADGSPLFATQLIGDWVRRDLLQVGAGGFALRAGEAAALPDDIHGLRQRRLDSVLSGWDPADATALQVAAALCGQASADCLLAGVTSRVRRGREQAVLWPGIDIRRP